MATMTGVRLNVTENTRLSTVECNVTGTVRFNDYETEQLQQGLVYRLKCELWGSDSYLHENPDAYPDRLARETRWSSTEYVAALPRVSITRDTPQGDRGPQYREFNVTRSFQRRTLDEDPGGATFSASTDEIFALLTLINTFTDTEATRRSNLVRL